MHTNIYFQLANKRLTCSYVDREVSLAALRDASGSEGALGGPFCQNESDVLLQPSPDLPAQPVIVCGGGVQGFRGRRRDKRAIVGHRVPDVPMGSCITISHISYVRSSPAYSVRVWLIVGVAQCHIIPLLGECSALWGERERVHR